MQTIRLNNGVEMPQLGYGVFQVSPEECERSVSDAIQVGYRSIDTAQIYRNEEWISNAGYERALASIDESLRRLQTDYIDLLLVHQPFGDYYGTYRAMEEAYRAGKLRAIGVSNFLVDRYLDLVHFVEIPPAVNQVETHVFTQQRELQQVMQETDTKLMSWGPFAEGKNDYFRTPTLVAIGEKYGCSAAQVALRYLLQRGIILIPKSVRRERMAQNFDIFGFTLDAEDMERIEELDTHKPLIADHRDPDYVRFLIGISL